MRKEQKIFDDLAQLCASPGYAHAIAYLCFRDNMVFYKKEGMTADDMRPLFSPDRLIRTEISILIGLLVKESIDYTFPDSPTLARYILLTEALLKELHESMLLDAKSTTETGFKQFGAGKVLREPIFYGGESAYSFQYRDLTPRKYAKDNRWLEDTKGFSIERVRDVANAVQKIQDEKGTEVKKIYSNERPDRILTGFTFSSQEVADRIGMDRTMIEKILTKFAVPPGDNNTHFQALDDFNVTNAAPLLRYNDDSFILFQQFSLVEAIYESPFYWMCQDDKYKVRARENRGKFTEEFCRERLEIVFGKENVYPNVKIIESKKDLGEIDVLVLFGDRAIVLQAKSKRLTLEARKGNDGKIREDFKKSVQNSYYQGYRDAKRLTSGQCRFVDAESNQIVIPKNIKEIYILCVVSDHYPALNFQTQEFLRFEKTDVIHPPFVMDVFTLDAMTEMLQSPLWLLSYINRRVNYTDRLLASNELVILSYHIKNNLWMKDEHHSEYFHDDISADLEAAMTVRREGISGEQTPDGLLKRFRATTLGQVIKTIEASPDPVAIDLGFMLLTLSGKTVDEVSKGIDEIVARAKKDEKGYDFTVGVREGSTGLTIHCNDDPMPAAAEKLQARCVRRKYTEHADSWFGMLISPKNATLRFVLSLSGKWKYSAVMDAQARRLPKSYGHADRTTPRRTIKIGRNARCHCGSGRKYKKCCLAR